MGKRESLPKSRQEKVDNSLKYECIATGRRHGYGFFGKGYARELAQFLAEHYEERAVIGARPMTDDRFGACVYRLAARPPGETQAADAPHAQ